MVQYLKHSYVVGSWLLYCATLAALGLNALASGVWTKIEC
jgi:hypothetical protein